jgi:hypothetical protein
MIRGRFAGTSEIVVSSGIFWRSEDWAMDEDAFNLDIRKFLKEVGITSQREIEKVVRAGEVRGNVLKLRMTLSSDTAPLNHVVAGTIRLKSN